MRTLAGRAERAVLGAILLRPDVYQDIAYLDPVEFADPAHTALFGAIRAELARDPDQSGSTLSANLDNLYAAPSHSPDYEALAAARPDTVAVPAYARMLVEADLHRTMQAQADRLSEIAEPNSQRTAEAVALDRGDDTASPEAEEAPIPAVEEIVGQTFRSTAVGFERHHDARAITGPSRDREPLVGSHGA